jgi:hypothetical protein
MRNKWTLYSIIMCGVFGFTLAALGLGITTSSYWILLFVFIINIYISEKAGFAKGKQSVNKKENN